MRVICIASLFPSHALLSLGSLGGRLHPLRMQFAAIAARLTNGSEERERKGGDIGVRERQLHIHMYTHMLHTLFPFLSWRRSRQLLIHLSCLLICQEFFFFFGL